MARPQADIEIVRSENENDGAGTFKWFTALSDGTEIEQSGYTKSNPNADGEFPTIQVIEGYYAYTADDGTPIRIQYVADENGYQPQGDHLPTPPPQIEGY